APQRRTSSQRTAPALPVGEPWARIAMKRKWFVLAIIIILIALVWLFREAMITERNLCPADMDVRSTLTWPDSYEFSETHWHRGSAVVSEHALGLQMFYPHPQLRPKPLSCFP